MPFRDWTFASIVDYICAFAFSVGAPSKRSALEVRQFPVVHHAAIPRTRGAGVTKIRRERLIGRHFIKVLPAAARNFHVVCIPKCARKVFSVAASKLFSQ
jgi:hypothetical protein